MTKIVSLGVGLVGKMRRKITENKKRVELNIVELYTGKEHKGALILRNEAHLHLNKVHRAFSYTNI